jgi:hypothetical protein
VTGCVAITTVGDIITYIHDCPSGDFWKIDVTFPSMKYSDGTKFTIIIYQVDRNLLSLFERSERLPCMAGSYFRLKLQAIKCVAGC